MDECKTKPLNREDVLKLIKDRGSARGLDLSNHVRFEEKIDLSGIDLSGINLQGAHLFQANFNGSTLDCASLRNANLEYATFNSLNSQNASLQSVDMKGAILNYAEFRGADLSCAEFQGDLPRNIPASLGNTDFRQAVLFRANFTGCFFYGTKLEGAFIRGADLFIDTHIGGIDWGNYIVGEERKGDYNSAEYYYRKLKARYTTSGYNSIANQFHFREKEASRKKAKEWHNRAMGWLVWAYFGHGIGWKRIFYWLLGTWLFFAGIDYTIGNFLPQIGLLQPNNLGDYLYFSAASLTVVGYGSWVNMADGLIKWLGVIETLVGSFMIASILVAFARKWTQ